MSLYVLLVLFSVFNCCKFDAIVPLSYESKLEKYETHNDYYKDSNDYSRDYNDDRRNQRFWDQSESSYEDDLEKIDEQYKKYIGGQKNEIRYSGESYFGRQRRYNDEEMKERLDKIFGYTGPTANDGPENLMRPCALDDWQCIRKYFAANGKCKPSYGPIPDPLYVDVNTAFFIVGNVTATLPNLQVRGLSSAKIRDFYVNKKSGNLVFAFDVQNLNQTIPRAYIRYRRTAKESIILADYGTVNFRSVTFTAVIPKIPELRLDLADVHADVQDGTPAFFLGPGAVASSDPDVGTGFAQIITSLPIAVREGFFFQAQLYTAIYIQKNICDFGLKLISV